MLTAAELHERIATVCPIFGVSLSRDVPPKVEVQYTPDATAEQRAAAEAVITGLDWDAPEPVRFFPPNTFRKLFSQSERFAIYASTDPLVMDFVGDLQTLRDDVDLQHPDTQAGVGYLEQIGLIAAGRATEILSGKGPEQ